MRALFLCPNLGQGGAERQWALLLPALAARSIEVSVVTLDGEGRYAEQLRSAGMDVAFASMGSRFDPGGWRRALALAPQELDAVVTRGLSAHWVGRRIARSRGAAHVAVEHTSYDLLPLSRHRRLLLRLIASGMDAVVGLSEGHATTLAEHGYPRVRVRLVANGVDAAELAPRRDRRAVRAELGLREDAFVALVCARLRPEKRVADFAAAIAAASAADSRIVGVVAGDGPQLPALEEAAARSGGALRAIGARTDVPDLLGCADVACLVSSHEAASMYLLEAMAAGLPIVATRVGATADLVVDGETGLLVAPNDPEAVAVALVALASDPERARRLGEAGQTRQRARFGIEAMAAAYERVLIETAGRRRNRASVAVVGPALDAPGGIAELLRAAAASPLRDRYELVGVATSCAGSRSRKLACALTGMARLAWLLGRRRVDLVHLHASSRGSLLRKATALFLCSALRVPAVLHVHGSAFDEQFTGSGVRGRLRRRLTVAALERADAVIALSRWWADELGRRATIRRLAIVPNFPSLPAETLAGASARQNGKTIAFLGRLHRDKGIDILLEAFAALHAGDATVRLVLAGDGPERARLERHVARAGLDDAVEFRGWLGEQSKAQLLAGSACIVLPSRKEGLPLALLEAMALGAPVVATRVGGVPETIRDGIDGLLVPPEDAHALHRAVERILSDPRRAARLGASAAERVRAEYSREAFAERLDAVYIPLLPGVAR